MRGRALLLMALGACSPPRQDDCLRRLVDVDGSLNRSLAGGEGGTGGSRLNPAVLGSVGVPVTLTFFAPLTSCVSDTLRLDAVVNDPDGQSAPAMQRGALEQSVFSAVKAAVTFTPTRPGLHTLTVAFEPSLGVRTRFVEVASDGLSGQVIRVPLPPGASSTGLWPLADDTVASEVPSVDDITLSSAKGALTHFRGAQLVVVGRVLWSIDPTTRTLERRVFEDGGVRLTHSFPGFPAIPTPALQEEDFALRYRQSGQLSAVSISTDGGVSVNDHSFDARVDPPLAYYGSLNRWSLEECPLGACSNITDLAAVDADFVWRYSPSPGLTGVGRFFDLGAAPLKLAHTPDAVSSPRAAFERLPLWLRTQSDDWRVLVSATGAGFKLTSWPRHRVLRVGREHVLLTDEDPRFVGVVRK